MDRSRAGLVAELEAAVMRRAMATSDSPDWCYLGGVADALEFALGLKQAFWWVPLSGPTARGSACTG